MVNFLLDDERWTVRYLVVEPGSFFDGKQVLVSLSREAIRTSPDWNPTAAIEREYEARLHDHHGRPAYWKALSIR